METFPGRIIILYTKSKESEIKHFENKNCLLICLNSVSFFKKNIPAGLKNSKLIFCDNYFAVLGGISFSKDTNIVQLWHANGAIKKFGLEAEYTKKTLAINKKRYQSVYNKFTHFVLSSSKMETIFSTSFKIQFESLFFGYPKTDIYFDKIFKQRAINLGNEIKKEKKLLLYVPTYRKEGRFSINVEQLQSELADEWIVYVHLHPHDLDLNDTSIQLNNQVDFSKWDLAELLFISDCLLTDYSSVPFEYALANPEGKVIYFWYDFDSYNKSVGIQEDFLESSKDFVAYDLETLLALVKSEKTRNNVSSLNKLWNEYANGNSISQLIEWIEIQDGN